jgi:hypothetical protein
VAFARESHRIEHGHEVVCDEAGLVAHVSGLHVEPIFERPLWPENRGYRVDVLGVSPGPVVTEFQAVAGETPHPGVTPESVVNEALAALGRKPSVITGGALNKMRTWSVRFAPRRQVARLALGVMRGFIPEALR